MVEKLSTVAYAIPPWYKEHAEKEEVTRIVKSFYDLSRLQNVFAFELFLWKMYEIDAIR